MESTPRIRYHSLDAYAAREQDLSNSEGIFGPAIPVSYDAATIDEGFTAFAIRYAKRVGHLQLGTLMLMAEAWGMNVRGSHALVAAHDHNLIIWPLCSGTYFDHLVYILTQPGTHAHPCSVETASDHSFAPGFQEADLESYDKRIPQFEPVWLPMVICAEREGLGKDVNDRAMSNILGSLPDALSKAMRAVLESMGASPTEPGVYTDSFTKSDPASKPEA